MDFLTATSTGISHAQAAAPKGVTIRTAWEWMLAGSSQRLRLIPAWGHHAVEHLGEVAEVIP